MSLQNSCLPFAILLVATLLSVPSLQAQDVDTGEVDALFSNWDKPDSPGCALGVYESGEIVYTAGYGSANLDYSLPIDEQTVFYIGSVSKQFAAAAIALLAVQGEIDLDDDIREYVPEMPDYGTPVTVRHLVHHTSGIRDTYAIMNFAGASTADVIERDDLLTLIARPQDLNFEPGEEYLYSNAGYFLMGVIVERASGLSLREYSDKHIFQPLGMESTHFHDDRTMIVPNRAVSYQPDGNSGYRMSYLWNFEGVGAGGLYTTIEDMRKWDAALYGNDLGAPGFLEKMHTPGILNDGEELHYAFALQFGDYKGLETVGHGGSFMGFRAHYVRFPEEEFSVAIFCNLGSINPGPLAHRVADIYLRNVFENHLSDYAGAYHQPDLDVTYEIEVKDGELHLLRSQSPNGAMNPVSTDTFRAGGWTVEFQRNDNGEVEGFVVDAGRARNVVFERR